MKRKVSRMSEWKRALGNLNVSGQVRNGSTVVDDDNNRTDQLVKRVYDKRCCWYNLRCDF